MNTFDNYSLAGDISVIAICLVMVILLLTSYVNHNRSFHIFMAIIIQLVVASIVNITYHYLLTLNNPALYNLIYVLRIGYNAVLFDIFFLFCLYTTIASGLDKNRSRIVAVAATILFVTIIGIDIIRLFTGTDFRILADGSVTGDSNLYIVGFVLYAFFIFALMIRVQGLLYKQIMYGFYGTMAISIIIRFAQLIQNRSSLTTMTFLFPVIAMFYVMHSNPYNVNLGTVDVRSMENMIEDMYNKKKDFIFMSFCLPEYNEEGKELPDDVKAVIREYSGKVLNKGIVFQVNNGHFILVAPKKNNPNFSDQMNNILKIFKKQHRFFGIAYKIVIGESIDDISRRNEYVSLINNIHKEIPDNTIHMVDENDIISFNQNEYILKELADIYNRRNPNDPRVLAYCQPVYNLITGEFDTAEALMRLDLKDVGIVQPERFIPIAESHGYIHVLTQIILNKACQEIRDLIKEGFSIKRISVNVSALELKNHNFCEDISSIIRNHAVPSDKVAIELTESHSEADFMIMKDKLSELHEQGVQFYLDDFGTGYSNMERIMELPFDIIKFDRSMVTASRTDERSEKIVENLAHMFKDMNYSILYEGVEDDKDESLCRGMSASYLQGFKYSHPVPIKQLREFLPKA